MSHDCPQQNWNRRGNSHGNSNFRGRGRGSQQRLNYRSNVRTSQIDGADDNSMYYNAESQAQEEFQVVRAITDTCTDQEHAEQWLSGVASESDVVKDTVLHSLWRNEDFHST
jgi:hypothetical protein